MGTNVPLKDLCLWVLPLVYISVTYNWQVGIRQIARGFCRSLHQPVWTFVFCISKDGDCHGHSVVKTHLCLPKKRPLWLHKNGSIALLFHPTIVLHPEVGRLPEEHDLEVLLMCAPNHWDMPGLVLQWWPQLLVKEICCRVGLCLVAHKGRSCRAVGNQVAGIYLLEKTHWSMALFPVHFCKVPRKGGKIISLMNYSGRLGPIHRSLTGCMCTPAIFLKHHFRF